MPNIARIEARQPRFERLLVQRDGLLKRRGDLCQRYEYESAGVHLLMRYGQAGVLQGMFSLKQHI